MTATAQAVPAPTARRSSWIDWLIARLDALPGPIWLAYVLLFGILFLADEAAHWAAGLEVGRIEVIRVVEASYPVLLIAGMVWLNGVASRSLDQLRPALTIADREVEILRQDLLRTPAGWAAIAALAGSVQGVVSVTAVPESYGITPGSPFVVWLGAVVIGAGTTILAFTFGAHAVHQLRVVTRVHRELPTIDVFRLDPLYAFASLTSWTGISLVALVLYGILAFSGLGALEISVIDVVTTIAFMVLAVVLFIIPLVGLHDRIQIEKMRHREAAGAALAAATAELNRRMATGQFENSKEVSDAILAATSAYQTVSRIPTWPWRQETLRGFLGAVALPIIIWSVTALLGRLI